MLARKASSNCADCHQQSYCLDCHKGGGLEADLQKSLSRRGEYMPKTHRSDFISIHPVKAADNPRDCYRCHESNFCSDCHNRQIQRNRSGMSIKRRPQPITDGIRFPRRTRIELGLRSIPRKREGTCSPVKDAIRRRAIAPTFYAIRTSGEGNGTQSNNE